jgi:hypothetical protein
MPRGDACDSAAAPVIQSSSRQAVHTPYMKMRVEGYRWPFVIDMQSNFVGEGRLRGFDGAAGRCCEERPAAALVRLNAFRYQC